MLRNHKPNEPNIKYYADGYVKTINGTIFVRENKTYVWDFYRDDEYLVKPENEVTEKKALEEFIKLYGDEDGFYTYNI